MKRSFLLVMLDYFFENIYFFCALYSTYRALCYFGADTGVANAIFAVMMFFFWLADRIKVERVAAHKDLVPEIQSRVEAETNRIKVVLLEEIRSSRG